MVRLKNAKLRTIDDAEQNRPDFWMPSVGISLFNVSSSYRRRGCFCFDGPSNKPIDLENIVGSAPERRIAKRVPPTE
jgi:hypothetical protein